MSPFYRGFLVAGLLLTAAFLVAWVEGQTAGGDKAKEKDVGEKAAAGDIKAQEAELAKLQETIAFKAKELTKLMEQALELHGKIAAQKLPGTPKVDYLGMQSLFQGMPVDKRPRDLKDTLGVERANPWLRKVEGLRLSFEIKVDSVIVLKRGDGNGFDIAINEVRGASDILVVFEIPWKLLVMQEIPIDSIGGKKGMANIDGYRLFQVDEKTAEVIRSLKGQTIPVNAKLGFVGFVSGKTAGSYRIEIRLRDTYIAGIKAIPQTK